MPNGSDKSLPLKSYLLGELNPDIQEQLEQQLMTDKSAFEELERVESELIDAYLSGDLSSDETERMESLFLLAPQRQQQLNFGRALRSYVEERSRTKQTAGWRKSWAEFWRFQNPAASWSVAAALLVLVLAGGVWSTLLFGRLETALNKARSDSANQLNSIMAQNEDLSAKLKQEQDQRAELEQRMTALQSAGNLGASALSVRSFDLSPGLLRDRGGLVKVSIPSGTTVVKLQLKLNADDYRKYRATLKRDDGTEILQITDKSEAFGSVKFVSILVQSSRLETADYSVDLQGIAADGAPEDIGTYNFRVSGR